MTKTLEDFERAFPTLYDHPGLAGFDCPDGWQALVWELSTHPEPLGLRCAEVKTKFGALRYYIEAQVEMTVPLGERVAKAEGLIRAAEEASLETCEFCGDHGRQWRREPGGQIFTICATCIPKILQRFAR